MGNLTCSISELISQMIVHNWGCVPRVCTDMKDIGLEKYQITENPLYRLHVETRTIILSTCMHVSAAQVNNHIFSVKTEQHEMRNDHIMIKCT